MFGANTIVDPKATAQGVEAGWRSGKFVAREFECINDFRDLKRATRGALQFAIDEFQIKSCIVYYQRRTSDKLEKRVGDIGKQRLFPKERVVQSVNRVSIVRHTSFGIEIGMKDLARRNVIDEFDASDLDDAMAIGRIKTGRFRIQCDFTHTQVHAYKCRCCKDAANPLSGRSHSIVMM